MSKIINQNKFLTLTLIVILLVTLTGCGSVEKEPQTNTTDTGISLNENELNNNEENKQSDININQVAVIKGSSYTSKEEVAVYLHIFKTLPPNYITKREAQDLGWDNSKGNLWDVTNRKSIGGDRFYNREGILPAKDGRRYYECDINYSGGYRGAERIVYSNDGLIYYTDDHYNSFERLY